MGTTGTLAPRKSRRPAEELPAGVLRVGEKPIKLSNLGKVLYPATGFTKGQVIDYYVKVAPGILPHLGTRPVSMKRYPNGVREEFFFEKRCPIYRPAWMKTAKRESDSQRGDVSYCMVDGLAGLVWVANLASIEFHTLLSAEESQRPTWMVFDLDPGPGTTLVDCAWLAQELRQALRAVKLQSWAKTSGNKGLHVCVPLNVPDVTFDDTKTWARTIAEELARRHEDRVTAVMRKTEREGKVFVDWSQNDDHKTTVCAYSLRATERPGVSTPVTWNEVARAVAGRSPKPLVFSPEDVIRRLARHGDLLKPLLTLKQRPAI